MKIKFLVVGIFFLVVSNVFSQVNLNQYKYVIVPNKFDFLKEKDQYQINSLAKFLFEKYGFTAFMEGNDYPKDLKMNRCLALRPDVLKESGMFKTRLKVELKDCNDRVVYTSGIGESREKEYKKAYNVSLRSAFESIRDLNYTYEPNKSITSLVTTTTSQPVVKNEVSKEIKALRAEIENLKKEKAKTEEVKIVEKPKKVVAAPNVVKEVEAVKEATTSNVLYAQEISNGFQLVDSTPKVVYKIKKTSVENVFLVKDKSAIIYKKETKWFIEFYSGNSLKLESLNIKF